MVLSPADPDRLYQQNHCGVYRLDLPALRWERIRRNLPAEVGDVGFPIVAHPRDPDTVWVFPMDGTSVWPRTAPGGRPAVFRSRDGGRNWSRGATGFPNAHGWLTVFRQAMTCDTPIPSGSILAPPPVRSGGVGMKARAGDRSPRIFLQCWRSRRLRDRRGGMPGRITTMPVKVYLSSHVRSYTDGQAEVAAEGGNLAELMLDLRRSIPVSGSA